MILPFSRQVEIDFDFGPSGLGILRCKKTQFSRFIRMPTRVPVIEAGPWSKKRFSVVLENDYLTRLYNGNAYQGVPLLNPGEVLLGQIFFFHEILETFNTTVDPSPLSSSRLELLLSGKFSIQEGLSLDEIYKTMRSQ